MSSVSSIKLIRTYFFFFFFFVKSPVYSRVIAYLQARDTRDISGYFTNYKLGVFWVSLYANSRFDYILREISGDHRGPITHPKGVGLQDPYHYVRVA